jgi:hypothetical protein
MSPGNRVKRAPKKAVTVALAVWIAAVFSASGSTHAGPTVQQESSPDASRRAFVDRYCMNCHNDRLKRGELSLASLDLSQVAADARVWEKVARKLRAGVMPPPGLPRPDKVTYESFTAWLEAELDRGAAAHPNPGRTEAIHRLNRTEYQNAIRDLLGLEVRIADLLPADDQSYGFDNIAGVLGISPTLLERYVAAARKISRLAIGGTAPATAETFRMRGDLQQDDRLEELPFGTRGGTIIRYNFPQAAEYAIDVELLGPRSETERLEVTLDGERPQLFVLEPAAIVPNVDGELMSQVPTIRLPVAAGPHDLAVTFIKKSSIEADGIRQPFLRPYNSQLQQPMLSAVTITGPFDSAIAPAPRTETPSRRAIFVCRPGTSSTSSEETSCARTILANLARRAYRRPVTGEDVQSLLTFYDEGSAQGGNFEAGIEAALRRLLVSPQFLFRIERDPPGAAPNTVYRVDDFELASRLSFFLWSSIPDEPLLDAASRGELANGAVLERQVRRMLADPRSKALVDNFAVQWLGLRKLQRATPQQDAFPDFDENLRQAMRRETELFVESILREDRSVVDLVGANYTFVNERLARHYGIPHVYGSDFRRVTFEADDVRGGLLGQGSILTVTSYATRTSPVLRGKWVLDNIVGLPPPPPPANVPDLVEKSAEGKVLSMRERMAQHRANPACAVCHNTMDPMGLPLESFDAVGRYRTRSESNRPIDASGVLPDGSMSFEGPAGLRRALLARRELFVTTLTEKLLTYALGRGLEYYDAPAVRRITAEAGRHDYRLSSLILGIVTSPPFQMRKSEP